MRGGGGHYFDDADDDLNSLRSPVHIGPEPVKDGLVGGRLVGWLVGGWVTGWRWVASKSHKWVLLHLNLDPLDED